MRSVKEIYGPILQQLGAANISNIRIPINKVYVDIEDVPNYYIREIYGCSRTELYDRIVEEMDSNILKEAIDDSC